MKKTSFFSLFFLMLAFSITASFAQISGKITPPSFAFETENPVLYSTVHVPVDFDVAVLRAEDNLRKLDNLPSRVGIVIPVNFTTENSGEWTTLPDGRQIWRLCIVADDAIALMFAYEKFDIPADGKLFIYNDKRSMLNVYTEADNPKRVEYATDFISGEVITFEYLAPSYPIITSPVIISDIVYGYSDLLVVEEYRDGEEIISYRSDPCEVDVNCPEGENWQDQKRGVVRLSNIIIGMYSYLCSGSLINNTSGDLDPLILSAYHCFEGITPTNANKIVFRFNYERPNCGSGSAPVNQVTGATILVNIPISQGSDGTLLRLNNDIPPHYNVYYNGWDCRNIAATSGVSIHHPDGDVKKISTFTSPLVSSGSINFGGGAITAPNSAWRVQWAPTVTNHGVTEGGSSGSPIFNQDKRIVGTLSGGSSYCTSPYSPDYYGKLWYHYNQMSNPNYHMKPYLDPDNTGLLFIDGTYAIEPCNPPTNLTVSYNSSCEASLEWEVSSNDKKYNIYRDDDQTPIASNITTTSYIDNEFDPSTEHTWSVKTVCDDKESEPASITKEACKCTGVTEMIVEYTIDCKAEITWMAPDSTDKEYNVYRDDAQIASNITTTFYTDTEFDPTLEHTWSITVICDSGSESDPTDITKEKCSIIGIEEQTANGIAIYPNPTSGQLIIDNEQLTINNVDIYDVYGSKQLSIINCQLSINLDISHLSAGIYFLRIETEKGEIVMKKVVKN